MDNKVLVAIIAAVAVVAAGCGAFLLLGGSGEKTVANILNIETEGTYEDATYDTVIISAAVGNGNVILKNLKIVKELIIRGGGSHSITLDGCEIEGTTTVEKTDGEPPRIVANNTQMSSVNGRPTPFSLAKERGASAMSRPKVRRTSLSKERIPRSRT